MVNSVVSENAGSSDLVSVSSSVSNRRPIVVCAGADENFAQGLGIALFSIVEHIPIERTVICYVLDGGLSEKSIEKIRSTLLRARRDVVVNVVKPDMAHLASFDVPKHYGPASLLRLLISDLVDASVERVLYVDSDTVTIESVERLFDQDMSGKAVFAVGDLAGDAQISRLAEILPDKIFPSRGAYLNSGVLLIDTNEWRSREIKSNTLEIIRDYGLKICEGDQDALNLVLLGDWGVLEERWNNQVVDQKAAFPQLFLDGRAVGIIHFIGACKPWIRGRRPLGNEQFFQASIRSGWLNEGEVMLWRLRRMYEASFLAALVRGARKRMKSRKRQDARP